MPTIKHNVFKLVVATFFAVIFFCILYASCTYSYGQKQRPQPRSYFISGNIDYWNIYYRTLEKTKQAILKSDMPVKEAVSLLDTLNILQNEIRYNVTFQDSVYSTSQKQRPDTSHKK